MKFNQSNSPSAGASIASDRPKPTNTPAQILTASVIGTTIEFFDFYIYATAAVLIFPSLFFPGSDPTTALLASFATFSIAFFARPLGAIVFGHYGDRIGRKTTLVAALLQRPKSGDLDDLAAKHDMGEPETAADQAAIPEQAAHLFRVGIRGHVEILGLAAEQQVTHATAHQVSLVAGIFQAV